MRKIIIGALLATLAIPAAAPAQFDRNGGYDRDHRGDRDRDRDGDRDRRGHDGRPGRDGWNDHDRGSNWRDGRRFDYNRPDPRYGGYDAARYYRDGNSYRERRLSRNDRVYRGGDGRYYCRRNDGTTGLILGGVLGGVAGNALDGGRSSTLGTLLGAGGGALLGRSIDRGNVRCR